MQTVPSTDRIVVGFDGSPAAESAVDWAAQQAKRRGVSLRVVAAIPWPYNGIGMGAATPFDPHELAKELAVDGQKRAVKILDEDQVNVVGVADSAANALVEESQSAGLVVVGHPSRSRLGQVFIGSVVYGVVAHAKCNVAVVPDGDVVLPGVRHAVVVGVDGSDAALAAVTQAAEEAHRWGAPLQIVQTWFLSTVTGWSGALAGTTIIDEDSDFFGKAARASVATAAAHAKALHNDLVVETLVYDEHPARALVDVSRTCGLLVVGNRGLGGFERLMLGSVSRYVIQHAIVPVLVVRR
ncbi:MAG: universal stress protein [Intrasporangium sp.]|uniref:universal stress protein n=1 Tax=Intrasporangium sp. TaxID=1925024 RepID=UPI00264A22D9|nr:universal stress protein [Intrasporangium sp.]MDN5796804.1 universal stress protein [Intrasporangium sp.]